jgi:hypothetical protein
VTTAKKTPAAKKAAPAAKKAAPAAKKTPAAKKATGSGLMPKVTDLTVCQAKPHIKFPATLPALADAYYETMQERLKLQKEVDKLEEKEKAFKAHLINNLPLSEANGVAGKVASVRIEQKDRVAVDNWDELQAYAIKNVKKGGFAIFQRRVNDAAIKELLADPKAKFKGAHLEQYKSLSYSKLK